jgi:hypothetical protein
MARGRAVGNVSMGKCAAASQVTSCSAHGSPVDFDPNSNFMIGQVE